MPAYPVGLAGVSNQALLRADSQRSINLFPRVMEAEGEKQRIHLIGTPGLSLFDTADYTPLRGCYVFKGRFFAVARDRLIEVRSDGTINDWGSIGSVSGSVGMCELLSVLVIGDGARFWAFDLDAETLTIIAGAPRGTYCATLGLRVAFQETGTGQVYYSELNDATDVPGLNVFTSESRPDNVTRVIATSNQLLVFNERSLDPYYVTEDADNPFGAATQGVIPYGTTAPDTVCLYGDIPVWLDSAIEGTGVVRMGGQRISTHAVEKDLKRGSEWSAFVYQEEGHVFYVISSDVSTWGYDFTTGLWHERGWWNTATAEYEPVRQKFHGYAYGKHLVTDRENGKIYEQSLAYYSDAGDAIVSRRITPHIDFQGKATTVDELYLDIQTGVGLETGQGVTPLVMLRYSTDGGHSWSNELHGSIGPIGEYLYRVRFFRLGFGRDWVFEVSISDPVRRVFLGAEAVVRVGRR